MNYRSLSPHSLAPSRNKLYIETSAHCLLLCFLRLSFVVCIEKEGAQRIYLYKGVLEGQNDRKFLRIIVSYYFSLNLMQVQQILVVYILYVL